MDQLSPCFGRLAETAVPRPINDLHARKRHVCDVMAINAIIGPRVLKSSSY